MPRHEPLWRAELLSSGRRAHVGAAWGKRRRDCQRVEWECTDWVTDAVWGVQGGAQLSPGTRIARPSLVSPSNMSRQVACALSVVDLITVDVVVRMSLEHPFSLYLQ